MQIDPNLSKWAVLFDLDETLVLTSAIEPLRSARVWHKVYAAFDETTLPAGTVEALRTIREVGFEVGVITKSPRRYAELLISHHQLMIPVIIGYHDVPLRKPHPASLLRAAALLRIDPEHCIYVGDHPDDITAARAAGFHPVGVNWSNAPRTLAVNRTCLSWKEVLLEIETITGRRFR